MSTRFRFLIANGSIRYAVVKRSLSKTTDAQLDLRRIGEVLKCARQNLRYSFRDLAKKSGISHAQLMRMESGEFEFSAAKLYRVCFALGIPIGDLFEYASARLVVPGAIRADPATARLLATEGKGANSRFESLVFAAFNLAMLILTASSPLDVAMSVGRYPSDRMSEAFHEFASMIAGSSNVERVATLESLKTSPYEKLKSLRLLTPEDVVAFLKTGAKNWEMQAREVDSITSILNFGQSQRS